MKVDFPKEVFLDALVPPCSPVPFSEPGINLQEILSCHGRLDAAGLNEIHAQKPKLINKPWNPAFGKEKLNVAVGEKFDGSRKRTVQRIFNVVAYLFLKIFHIDGN